MRAQVPFPYEDANLVGDLVESSRAKLEALITLSFGHLSRFQFAGINVTRTLYGGLGTDERLSIWRFFVPNLALRKIPRLRINLNPVGRNWKR